MKENKYMQCILCEGETFQEAVDKFNYEMMRNAAYNPTFERAGEKFLRENAELYDDSLVDDCRSIPLASPPSADRVKSLVHQIIAP